MLSRAIPRVGLALALVLAVADLGAPTPGWGASAYQAPRQADGLPDWSGVWIKQGFNSMDPTVPNDEYQYSAPLTDAARRNYEAYREGIRQGRPRGDIGCLPEGMPRIMRAPYPLEIVLTRKQAWVLFEFKGEVRRIYTDGRKPPAADELEHTYEGFSTGRWEGDTLVVDTVGLKAGTIDSRGLVHSDKMTVHERFRRVSDEILQVEITMTDPEVFTRPWTVVREYKRQPTWAIKEFVCAENDRNPIGADGVTRAR